LTLEQTRQVIDKLSVDLPAEQSVYAYSLPYIFYDQYSYIKAVAIQNVLLALATIFFTVTIIQDTISAIIVCVVVFIISFNLIGLVWLLNVIFGGFQIQINAISVVNLVTCLGLAVEFCVHMVIKFRMTVINRLYSRLGIENIEFNMPWQRWVHRF
jgi:Niemann-Pick C1 protein